MQWCDFPVVSCVQWFHLKMSVFQHPTLLKIVSKKRVPYRTLKGIVSVCLVMFILCFYVYG